MKDYKLPVAFASLLSLLALGTVMYRFLEDWTWIQSFYFSVATLTTVGYGDLAPTSDSSRLFTSIYIIVGVAVAISVLTLLGNRYLSHQHRRIENRRK